MQEAYIMQCTAVGTHIQHMYKASGEMREAQETLLSSALQQSAEN